LKTAKKILIEIIRMIFIIILVSALSFILVTNAPIDPLVSYIGTNSTLSQQARDEISEYWGLNRPLPERFFKWAANVLKGDMGISITYKRPVSKIIAERFGYSFVLMALAWIFSGIVGFFTGILCGIWQESIFDKTIKVFCLVLKSAPTFWLGLIIIIIFAVQLGWFPIGMSAPIGKIESEITLADKIYHLILPVLTLTLINISEAVLYTRQKLIEIWNSNFILYARARGETTIQIVKNHIIKNIILPFITIQFASFSELFGGMTLAENVFSYPGIGTATTAAALNGDVPLLLGIAVCSALFVFTGNLIANILYGIFDPRTRVGENM